MSRQKQREQSLEHARAMHGLNDVSIGEGAMISFRTRERKDVGNITPLYTIQGGGKYAYKKWGDDNDLPLYREHVLADNNIMGELIKTKRDIMIGNGIFPYREEIEIVGDKRIRKRIPLAIETKIQNWMDDNDWEGKLISAAGELLKHENVFPEFVLRSGAGTAVADVKIHSCKYIRIAEKDIKGNIKRYLYCSNWRLGGTGSKKYPIKAISALDPNKNNSILHVGDNLFNDGYYNKPAYWGGKEWIELANAIPLFHKANLRNSFSPKIHISMPANYFLSKLEWEKALTDDQKKACMSSAKAKRSAFIADVNKYLAGVENAGRAIFTSRSYDALTSKYEGIEITPLDVKMHDEAMLKLFASSNQANISSQGLHPTLANIESQGKLSSGSEMRNAFNFYTAIKTQTYRKNLLKIHNKMIELQGWKVEGVKWGFEDIQLKSTDEEPTGVAAATPQGQAA